MFLGQYFEIFDWFIIYFTENNGMAFGLELGGELGKLILTLTRIFIVVFAVRYLLKTNLYKYKSPYTCLLWSYFGRCNWKYYRLLIVWGYI